MLFLSVSVIYAGQQTFGLFEVFSYLCCAADLWVILSVSVNFVGQQTFELF